MLLFSDKSRDTEDAMSDLSPTETVDPIPTSKAAIHAFFEQSLAISGFDPRQLPLPEEYPARVGAHFSTASIENGPTNMNGEQAENFPAEQLGSTSTSSERSSLPAERHSSYDNGSSIPSLPRDSARNISSLSSPVLELQDRPSLAQPHSGYQTMVSAVDYSGVRVDQSFMRSQLYYHEINRHQVQAPLQHRKIDRALRGSASFDHTPQESLHPISPFVTPQRGSRDTSHPNSTDHLLAMPQPTPTQPLPDSFPFDPREALRPDLTDRFFAMQQPTPTQPLPDSFPFDPRDALRPDLTDRFFAMQQPTPTQPLPGNFPFNSREALHQTSMTSCTQGEGIDRVCLQDDPPTAGFCLRNFSHQSPAVVLPLPECQAF
jgi:hypothetical protein